MIKKIENFLISKLECLHQWVFGQPMTDGVRKFLANLRWGAISYLAGAFFVTNIIAVRVLGPEEYGKYSLILTLAQFLFIPMALGLPAALIKYVASEQKKYQFINAAFWMTLTVCFFVCVMLWVFQEKFISFFRLDQRMFIFLLFLSIFLVIKTLVEASLKGLQFFKFISFLEIVNSLVIFIVFFGYLLVFKDYSFQSYLTAVIFGFGVYIIFSLTKNNFFQNRFNKEVFWKLIHYGIYGLLGSFAGFIFGNASKLMLNNFAGFGEVGIFTVYSGAALFLSGKFSDIFINVFFPMASSYSDSAGVYTKLSKFFRIFFLPFFLFNCAVILILFFFYGKKYEADWLLVILFSLDATISFFYQSLMWLTNAEGVNGVRFTVSRTWAVSFLALILYYVFVRLYGVAGAVLVSVATNTLLFFIYKRRFLMVN